MTGKPTLRQLMREQRRLLNPLQQRRAAVALSAKLHKLPLFQRAQRIAAYLPNDGEIDTLPLLRRAHRQHKHIYLPVLRDGSLLFVRYRPGITRLQTNQFGIPEPQPLAGEIIAVTGLDLALLPLVAFDRQGHRLGMGGGFYDKTFACKQRRRRSRPLLIGLAHHMQQVAAIETEPWDVPLAGVVTDRAVLLASNTRRRAY
jgi:5-formyltetrahydrofolate cyclo-ligase